MHTHTVNSQNLPCCLRVQGRQSNTNVIQVAKFNPVYNFKDCVCMCVCVCARALVSRLCQTQLCDPMDCSLCPWNSLGKNTRVGYPRLLQGIVLTQGLNPDLLHCRQILHHLSHQKGSNNFNNIAYVAQSVQFSCSVVSNSLQLHGLQHARLPCPSSTPGACSNLYSSSR